jgi:hypothetical protein
MTIKSDANPFNRPLTDAELDDLIFSPMIEADEIVHVSARPRRHPERFKDFDVETYLTWRTREYRKR